MGQRRKRAKAANGDPVIASRVNALGQRLRGWAKGARATIMSPHVNAYAMARTTGGWLGERAAWQSCCHEFNQLVPWGHPDSDEVPLPLAKYDPLRIDESVSLSDEEITRRSSALDSRNDVSSRVLLL